MEGLGVGLITAIIVGGIAGWVAEKFMKSDMGLFMNIILGIAGAFVLNLILGLLGVGVGGGIIVYFIVAVIGACLLIFLVRQIRGRGRA